MSGRAGAQRIMPIRFRRALYGLLAGLGLVLMLPLLVHGRRLQAGMLDADPMAAAADPAVVEGLVRFGGLFLVGICVATGFLYAALSAGYARAWRPRGDGSVRCGRCGADVSRGAPRCDTCGQHLVW